MLVLQAPQVILDVSCSHERKLVGSSQSFTGAAPGRATDGKAPMRTIYIRGSVLWLVIFLSMPNASPFPRSQPCPASGAAQAFLD